MRTKHVVYGFESEMGVDFSLEIPPKRELIGELDVDFGSTDCLKLNLDKYGYTDERFIFVLHFRDSYDNEYHT
ncbi:hypothetical protein MKY09_11530 [Psychrobacillus sp. FSL K6-4046]|uniref:hypothetical protein n=1 Tax=Psychrobacillus sp. FSL K6-4046 TaxID=2921550 RepID=UPI00315AC510